MDPPATVKGDVGLGSKSNTLLDATHADHPVADTKPTSSVPTPGTRLGQYELIRELGRGGMGAVYLARDTKLGRRVAIKFLHSEQAELTVRFILEARATAQCSHENIIVIHEVGEYQDHPFMVLEYLQGAPLSKHIGRERKLPPQRAVELMVPVVRALACAHAHNIVHRDLKPDNIFVTESGTVKVLDFGIAKLLYGHRPAAMPAADAATEEESGEESGAKSGAQLTRQGALIGTVPYMSPEQWGVDEVDYRTDIWAVGIMLYSMIAGRHPLAPRMGRELMITGILTHPMPTIRSACPGLSPGLADIIDRCLIKPKHQRMGSAQELLEALEEHLPGRQNRRLRADERPYAGLRSFQETDANRFFGRTGEIAAAIARLRDQPLLGVVGPSGVGKSSFVRAGLLPALKDSGEPWTSLVVRPGRNPLAALAHLVTSHMSTSLSGQTSTTLAGELSEHHAVHERLYREPGYLGIVLRSWARKQGQNIVLFVDQFEEVYTLVADAGERMAFTACLASVADDVTTPLRVILSIRSDFLDRVAEDAHFLGELTRGLFFLTPPNRAGLRDALLQPADMAGYAYESMAMVEHMLDHLEHTPGALPLLQFAATQLWELRDRHSRVLTASSYRQIGGIAGALARHADAVLAELPASSQTLARRLFLRLVTPERTRALVSMEELQELSRHPEEVRGLLSHLVHARLLVVQTGAEGNPVATNSVAAHSAADSAVAAHSVTAHSVADSAVANSVVADSVMAGSAVEIVHESLIHSWPRLQRWLDENQEDAGFLDQLRTAAKQWRAKGCPHGLLWRGDAAAEAQRWYRRYRGELPGVEQDYLRAVFGLAARAARTKRMVLAGTIGLLSLLVAAAAVALVLIREAQEQATEQARVARTAETQVREQLANVHAEQRARQQAESQAQAAQQQAQAAQQQAQAAQQEVEHADFTIFVTNEQLKRKNAALLVALKRARQARHNARNALALAQQNEAAARTAELEARQFNEELQLLLAREQTRNAQVETAEETPWIEDIHVD